MDKKKKKRFELSIEKRGNTAPYSCEAGGWKLQIAPFKEENDGVMGAVLSQSKNALQTGTIRLILPFLPDLPRPSLLDAHDRCGAF